MRRIDYDVIDSTNSEARLLAGMHPGEPILITAATQSAGRGRHGRVWQSPLGGAWMSIVWPTRSEPRVYAPISLVAAVAVRRALEELTGDAAAELRVKWPNDLLMADRKVAGILCEHVPGGSGGREGILIVGIGVNVEFDASLLAANLRHPATTLSAAIGRPIDLEEVIGAVSRHVVRAMETFERDRLSEALLSELRANLAYVGSVRTWSSPRGAVTGRVLGVDDAGRLLLEGNAGKTVCDVGEFVA